MGNGTDILIVEDDKDLVNTIRIILENKNYQVRVAFNGKEGYKMIEEKIPDLIILDVMMKTDTDGFDLAFKLKNISKYNDIPILMVTSFPQKMAEKGPERFKCREEFGWSQKFLNPGKRPVIPIKAGPGEHQAV